MRSFLFTILAWTIFIETNFLYRYESFKKGSTPSSNSVVCDVRPRWPSKFSIFLVCQITIFHPNNNRKFIKEKLPMWIHSTVHRFNMEPFDFEFSKYKCKREIGNVQLNVNVIAKHRINCKEFITQMTQSSKCTKWYFDKDEDGKYIEELWTHLKANVMKWNGDKLNQTCDYFHSLFGAKEDESFFYIFTGKVSHRICITSGIAHRIPHKLQSFSLCVCCGYAHICIFHAGQSIWFVNRDCITRLIHCLQRDIVFPMWCVAHCLET